MSIENDLDKSVCVYLHINPEIHEVFYVGIGAENRPFNRMGRSREWKDYVQSIFFNYNIVLLYESITHEDAANIEKQLIAQIGRKDKGLGTLVNKSDGGQTASRKVQRLLKEITIIDKQKTELEHSLKRLIAIENNILLNASLYDTEEEFLKNNPEDYKLSIKLNIVDKVKSTIVFSREKREKEKVETENNLTLKKLNKISKFVMVYDKNKNLI